MERIVSADYELVDTYHGLMLCNRHDMAMTNVLKRTGKWEWEEIEETRQYATGTVIDIGANIGTHTLVYARTAQQVIAFEPQYSAYNNLCANLLLNNVLNVTPVPYALGSYDGMTTMYVQDPTSLNSTPGGKVAEGEEPVVMHRLDTMGISGVSLIKIDCEGSELDVLQGGMETIRRSLPVIYVEIHFAELVEPIISLLAEAGYVNDLICVRKMIYPEEMYPLPPEAPQTIYNFLCKPGEVPHD